MLIDYSSKIFEISDQSDHAHTKIDIDYDYDFHSRDEIQENILIFFGKIKNLLKFYFLIDHTCLDCFEPNKPRRFTLIYNFLNPESHRRLEVHVRVSACDKMISLRSLWPGAGVLEDKVFEDFGVQYFLGRGKRDLEGEGTFVLRKDNELKVLKEEVAPKDAHPHYLLPLKPSPFESRLKWKTFGPNGFPMYGKGRLDVLMDDKTSLVARSVIRNGFHKRDLEKQAERQSFSSLHEQVMHYSSQNSLFYSLLFCDIIESIAGVAIPDRAQALRMVLCEVARIESHLLFLFELTSMLGMDYESKLVKVSLLECSHLANSFYGEGQFSSPFQQGGMCCDVPKGWLTLFLDFNKKLLNLFKELRLSLYKSKEVLEQMNREGTPPQSALDYGLTGPVLRACGVNYDLRKTQKLYFYDDVEFEIPLGIDGTNYDRLLVRCEEMNQSLSIISQVMNLLPRGDYCHKDFFDSDSFYGSAHEIAFPEGEIYRSMEGPEGEMGLLYVSAGQKKLERLHYRTPSLMNMHYFNSTTENSPLNETLISLHCLNINYWEVDG